jgi:hypothetical protein
MQTSIAKRTDFFRSDEPQGASPSFRRTAFTTTLQPVAVD